ncbi:MAG: retropepsin-like aspartic protease [Longimicrobiales bacterium]
MHLSSILRRPPLVPALLLAACVAEAPAPVRTTAPADSAAGEIGFEYAGAGEAAIVVPVVLNGQGPYDFVLDTGATVTCVDLALAEELGLEEVRGMRGIGAGATGTGQMRLVTIDSVRVGGARAEEVIACALDLAHVEAVGMDVDGLIGLNFLRPFRLALDFDRQVLRLTAPGALD